LKIDNTRNHNPTVGFPLNSRHRRVVHGYDVKVNASRASSPLGGENSFSPLRHTATRDARRDDASHRVDDA
jgi:hypothetical protein